MNTQLSQGIECPRCHQSDKITSAYSAQIAAPIQPSAFARNLMKVLFWTLTIVWAMAFLCNLAIMIFGAYSLQLIVKVCYPPI